MSKSITGTIPVSESRIDIMNRGMQCLKELLGLVDAEKFIAFVNSEQMDYTKWQRTYFDQMTPEEIDQEAMEYIEANSYQGDAATIV